MRISKQRVAKSREESSEAKEDAHAFLAGMDYSMDDSEPHGYREARASPEREKWLTEMKEGVKLLNQMETWQLVKPHPGRKVLTGV